MCELVVARSLTDSIKDMVNSSSSTRSAPSIFRVCNHFRSINPEDYDPKVIAIGPFHRDKPQLQEMEHHKLRYLNLLLQRKPELSLQDYCGAMIGLEERARECYAGDIGLDRDEFVQMLVLDACFILEFLRKRLDLDRKDPIFQYKHIQILLHNDLLVFENQIPFFVVKHLFEMTKDNEETIYELIWRLLQNRIYPVRELPGGELNGPHLLGIVHHVQCSSFAEILSNRVSHNVEVPDIRSAVQLTEAGIGFEKSEGNSFFHIEINKKTMIGFKKSEGNSFFHIEINKKKMMIPAWEIYDQTELFFRNLIAYEQYFTGDSPKRYVTDYVSLMHCLIRSPEDEKLLCHSGILINGLGGDETVHSVISQLDKNNYLSVVNSYSDIFLQLNKHCKHRRNIWMATLRRDYFSSPWSLTALIGAIALFLLTITQTTFAILSYRNDLKNGGNGN